TCSSNSALVTTWTSASESAGEDIGNRNTTECGAVGLTRGWMVSGRSHVVASRRWPLNG
ncbi:unnamed protein product, partial [Pylaiella littoralis]